MFYSTLTLRFNPASGSFDDARLDEFAKSKELLAVKEHFFEHGGLPHLLLCVTWRMPPAGSARKTAPDDEAWKGLLTTPEAQERFDRLRRWRNERAKKDGSPAYAIMTNRTLAEVAAIPTPSLSAFGAEEGFGPARVEWYGRDMDDALVFGKSRAELKAVLAAIRGFLAGELHLPLKDRVTAVHSTKTGVPFLGFRVKSGGIEVRRESFRRFRAGVCRAEWLHRTGRLSIDGLRDSVTSRLARLSRARSLALRSAYSARSPPVEW